MCYDVSSQESYTIAIGNEVLYTIVPQTQSYVRPSTAGLRTKAKAFAAIADAAVTRDAEAATPDGQQRFAPINGVYLVACARRGTHELHGSPWLSVAATVGAW